jgi:hypothetical protein
LRAGLRAADRFAGAAFRRAGAGLAAAFGRADLAPRCAAGAERFAGFATGVTAGRA